eukprot:CAMPEP_0181035212 /NCGR_PEP_ID=MMETSP1070-20121207/8205_1 /TAXON_ID=265543 /ORGANISM="Minutocellus polymorphus, Strain NH13" /LENGTH=435 /DNA_ID=CAMNT_0023112761 /DNA_START=185 /DNA_END=1492 /DNA_ORIENTATION=-
MVTAVPVRTASNKENGTTLSPTSASKIKKEAQSLRRELAQRTDERAQVELELLNAVAGLEEEKSALIGKLRTAIHHHDEATLQIDSLNRQVSDVKRGRAVETNAHEKTTQMLKIKCRDLDEAIGALELADREVRQLKAKDEEREARSSRDRARIERLEAELGRVDTSGTDVNTSLGASTEKEQGGIDKKAADIEQLHAALAEANAVINAKGTLVEDLTYELAKNTSSKQKEMADLEEQNKTLCHEIQVVNSVLSSTEKLCDELKDQIEALKDQQMQQLPNTIVVNLRRELEIAEYRNADLESELTNYRATIDTLQKEKVEVADSIERHLREIASGNSQLRAKLHAKETECLALRSEMDAVRENNSTVGIVATVITKEQCYQSPRTVMEPVAMVSPDRDEINPPSCGLKGDEAAQRLRDYKKEKKSTTNRARIPSF